VVQLSTVKPPQLDLSCTMTFRLDSGAGQKGGAVF
jgi:hypothetical protein